MNLFKEKRAELKGKGLFDKIGERANKLEYAESPKTKDTYGPVNKKGVKSFKGNFAFSNALLGNK